MEEIVILGAGISGISAAYHANFHGISSVIFEASDAWGGLIGNFSIDGFRFDNAIHLSFTNDQYVRSIFDQIDCIKHNPRPYNYEKGKWLKHPVETNLYPLDVNDKVKAIKGFLNKPESRDVLNYREWLIQQYGNYIAERFPVPYTAKYWTLPPEKLSVEWVGNRMYKPKLDEILFGAMTPDTPSAYYAKEMRYPKNGGFQAFLEPMASQLNIKTGKRVVHIDSKTHLIDFADGDQVYYQNLISSIPLPDLIKLLSDVPDSVKSAAESLTATSVALVSLGFNHPEAAKHLWFYIYDSDLLPARVYSPSIKSSDNVPKGFSSLQFEIYFSKYKPMNYNNDDLIQSVISSLEKMGLASKNDIVLADCRVLKYGNVVFEHGMLRNRNQVTNYLDRLGIISVGRFGEWDYFWSDQSLMSGKRGIERLMNALENKINMEE